MEKRMYFLVPYNISPIQQAIQAGHAALEYANKYKNDEEYIDFIENWKTWIILNGGTTNHTVENEVPRGTLNQDLLKIKQFNGANPDNRIKYATFCEPDLNDALTAICLVVDERIFDKNVLSFNQYVNQFSDFEYHNYGIEKQIELYKHDMGMDDKTYFLRDLLNNKKLA